MKKIISLLMIMVLCLGLVCMTGCGEDEPEDMPVASPFEGYNLADYVTLPDYESYEVVAPEVTVTDEDIDMALDEILAGLGTTESVTEGKVQEGDTVKISFEGTLEDGTTSDSMKSESTTLTLGAGGYIDGFEEGIYGATIGTPVTVDLSFPEEYPNNPDYAGKGVTFVITVLSKEVTTPAEFNEEFVKANSEFKTTEEYRNRIAEMIEEKSIEKVVAEKQYSLYEKISDEAVVSEAIPEILEAEKTATDAIYRKEAEKQGLEWETFLKEYFNWDVEEYDDAMTEYCEVVVKEKMIIYALAEKEGVQIMQSEYDALIDSVLLSAGVADEEEFETVMGVPFNDYAHMYGLDLNLILDKTIQQIYNRIVK